MNFFASNFGSPCCTHSEIIFSELKFPLFIACRAPRWGCSRRSHPSEQDFPWLFRLTLLPCRLPFFDIDSAALITKPFLPSLSLCPTTVSRLHAFSAFYLKSKIIMRNVRNRGFKHCRNIELSSVLARGFPRSRRNCGSGRWWAPCHHPRNYSCRTRWAHYLCLHLTRPNSQISQCRCGVARVLRF